MERVVALVGAGPRRLISGREVAAKALLGMTRSHLAKLDEYLDHALGLGDLRSLLAHD